VTNVQKGHVPAQAQSVARYVAKYVVSPPIAVRRIDRYDGERVTYHDRSHRPDRMEYETVPVDTFIGRMVQHTMPKGFKRIRYYGVQAALQQKSLLHRIFRYKNRALWSRKSLQNEAKKVLLTDGSAC